MWHFLRGGKLERIVATGEVEGRGDGGRRREKLLDGLSMWLGWRGEGRRQIS